MGQAQRLELIRWMLGLPRVDVAIATGACARLAEDLERGRAAAPALGDVGAAGLLADRVQVLAVDQLLDVEVARVGARRADFHPLRAARTLRHWKRRLHRRSVVAARYVQRDSPSPTDRRPMRSSTNPWVV